MRGLAKIICLGFVLAACGGSSDSPPGPLAKHFDDMYIARIPLEQKQSVVQTNNDYSVSKMEAANAQANFEETDSQLHQAKNDASAAKLQVDSAVSAKKSADASADTNRVNQAVKDLHTAEDAQKAAQARVAYLTDYRNYMKSYWRYTQENQYWREAQFEQAKSQIAKQNNIAPKGVNYDDYPKQVDSRGKRTQSSKERSQKAKEHVMGTRENWQKLQHQADTEAGKTSSLWDPMATQGQVAAPQQNEHPQAADIKSMPMAPAAGSDAAPPQQQPQQQ
jgi:hypothetical protein